MPPIIGAAMRFIASAPASVAGDHMIGSSPNRIAHTVMTDQGEGDRQQTIAVLVSDFVFI